MIIGGGRISPTQSHPIVNHTELTNDTGFKVFKRMRDFRPELFSSSNQLVVGIHGFSIELHYGYSFIIKH